MTSDPRVASVGGAGQRVEPCPHVGRRGVHVRAAATAAEMLAALELAAGVGIASDRPDGTAVDCRRRVRDRVPDDLDDPIFRHSAAGSDRSPSEADDGVTLFRPADARSGPTARLSAWSRRRTGARTDGGTDRTPDDHPRGPRLVADGSGQPPSGVGARSDRDGADLAALFENIPDPAVEARMVDGTPLVERVNPAFESVFGLDGDEIRGEDLDAYIVPETGTEEAVRYNERIEAGDRFHGEVRRRAADGPRDFILHVVARDVDEQGPRGYAIYTDITEQKQRQRELERQNRRIESLHDVATRMKTATDRAEIYAIVIDAAEDVLAFDITLIDEREDGRLVTAAVGSGVTLADYYEETPIDRPDNLGAETARTGETQVVDDLRASRYAPANYEYRSGLSVPLGEWGIFQAAATEAAAFTETDRQLAELLAEHAETALDRLARERELEERAAALARQNERLDRFASVVSHDLRNPLSVARGRLDMARSTGDDAHFSAVERAHERIDDLVTGLLTLARRGELRSDPVPVDLEAAVREAWQTVDTRNLELVVEDAPTLRADPERLRQLLENVVRNAVDHADGATTVTVGTVDDGDGFYVADDGAGIPAGERDGILESGHTGSESGTGLGLAIVDTVADAHGWTITIGTSDGGGARFEFDTRGDA